MPSVSAKVPDARFRGIVRLGDRTIAPDAGRIGAHHVDPRAMDVLMYLIARAPGTASVNQIIDGVWQGVDVHDNVVHRAISRLRRVLDDDPRHPRFIETVPRRGYRMAVAAQPDEARHSERCMAVVPFECLRQGRSAHTLDETLAADLSACLGATDWEIVDPGLVAATADRADTGELGARLGAGYLLTGSVQRAAGKVTLSARLCHCFSGLQIWTGRWSGTSRQYALSREVLVRAVAQAAHGKAARHQITARSGSPDAERSPWWLLYLAGETEDGRERVRLMQLALDLDPNFAPAHALLGSTRAQPLQRGADRLQRRRRMARHRFHLDRALQLAPDDFQVLRECSMAARFLGDRGMSLELARRAYAISPLAADVYGIALINAGQDAKGLTLLEEAAREPWTLLGDGVGFWASGGHPKIRLAHGYCRLGRFDDALRVCNEFLALRPGVPWMMLLKVNLLAQVGQLPEAAQLHDSLTDWVGDWTIADYEQFYADMAGYPDTEEHPPSLAHYTRGLRRLLCGRL